MTHPARVAFRAMASCTLLALAAPQAANAQSSVAIPLSGTLESRCSARVHDLQVTPGQDLKIVLFIDHSCNSGHTLLLRVRKGSGADLTHSRSNYAGKSPNQTTDSDITFRFSGAADEDGLMTVVVPNVTGAEQSAILDSLSVSVLPD